MVKGYLEGREGISRNQSCGGSGGVLVSKDLRDQRLDARKDEGMTHGLVGGNIRVPWIGRKGTQGNRSKEDWEKKMLKRSRWCFAFY